MVVPIRELVNKQLSTSTISSKLLNMAHLLSAMNMVIDDITRERFNSSSKMSSRSASVVSDALSILYHLRMEINNDLPDKITVKLIDSSQLSYQDDIEGGGVVHSVRQLIQVLLESFSMFNMMYWPLKKYLNLEARVLLLIILT